MVTILDFQIQHAENATYTLQVFERNQSQPLASHQFAFDDSHLTQYELARLEQKGNDPEGRLENLTAFGQKLHALLFPDAIQDLWVTYKAERDFLVLCLRLAPEAQALRKLPWETLHDGEAFLAAGATTGMSRLPLDTPPQPDLEPIIAPIDMLAVVSSPLNLHDGERLQIEREMEILLQAINAPSGQGRLNLRPEDEAKLPLIEAALNEKPNILHYTGHGMPGGLLLEDENGEKRRVQAAELLPALDKARGALRLAVLSGCQTAKENTAEGLQDTAHVFLQRGLPGVIAMQYSITDHAGLLFAETLYPLIAEGQPLEKSVSTARRALLHHKEPHVRADAVAPVLLTTNGDCLKTIASESPSTSGPLPEIDLSFFLPLPQLDFGFYGRRKEYRQIRNGLMHQNHRAVMIHGIGGVGKTALVSHVAERLRSRFNGVYAFDCSGGGLAPQTILLELHRYFERLGITQLGQLLHAELPPDQSANYLSQILQQWPLLLIFDNVETLLSRAENTPRIEDPALETFLKTLFKSTAKGSRFLFTTRYRFNLDDNRVGTIQELSLQDLSRPEALGLMQKLPGLGPTGFADKLQAYDTFGGHPYALVALSRYATHRKLKEIFEETQSLTSELREFLAIELNYAQLSDPARTLLNKLAAFKKPVSHEAVAWVSGEPIDREEVARQYLQTIDRSTLPEDIQKLSERELIAGFANAIPEQRQGPSQNASLSELVDWGLLTQTTQEEGIAVHSLVRDFCQDKQTPESWQVALKDAAAFFTNQTERQPSDARNVAALLNDRRAFELLMEAEAWDSAINILYRIDTIMNHWGFHYELQYMYERLLKEPLTGAQNAGLVHNIGILYQNRGDYENALTYYQQSLKILEELGNKSGIASSLHNIGSIYQERGDYENALSYYQQSLKIQEELGNKSGIASSLHQIGILYQDRGDYENALSYYQQSLKIKEELGNKSGIASSLHQIGSIYQDRGDYENALSCYQQSLKIKEVLGNKSGIASSLHQIGILYQDRGDYENALSYYQQSLKIEEELGNKSGIANSYGQIGKLYHIEKRYADAFRHLIQALGIFVELGSPSAQIAVGALRELRSAWGAAAFEAAWHEATGEALPETFLSETE